MLLSCRTRARHNQSKGACPERINRHRGGILFMSSHRFVPTVFAACSAVATLAAVCGAEAAVTWPDVMVLLHGSGHAYIVDTRSDKVVADLETVKGGSLGSTTPDGKKVYIGGAAEGQREVVVVDLAKKSVTARIETGNRPKHQLVSPDGKWVGVNHWGLDNGKLRVSFIDTATDKVVKTVELEVSDPASKALASMHNAWSWDSSKFFTVDRISNKLVVIDMKSWSVTSFPVESSPHYPVPAHDGKELWLVLEGGKPGIVVYDLTKSGMPVKAKLDMPLIGQQAVEAHHGNFTQDSKYFLALNRGPGKDLSGNEVAVFDAATKKLVTRLETRSSGIGHAYNTPDGKLAVVTNYGNNVLSVIDIASMKIVKEMPIGTGRMGHIAFTKDGRYGYVSNDKDGSLYKIDMRDFLVIEKINTPGGLPGAGQVLNVWTNVFEELPR
jgi:DNA-binding beta-propeller fold protein YncE